MLVQNMYHMWGKPNGVEGPKRSWFSGIYAGENSVQWQSIDGQIKKGVRISQV